MPTSLDAETRLRLFERGTDVVLRYRLRPTPAFEYVSPSISALLEHTAADCYANPQLFEAVLHPDDRRFIEGPHDTWAKGVEMRWVSRGGLSRWTLTHRHPVLDASGELIGIDLIIRDIDAQKALEAERQFSSRLLDTTHAIVLVLDEVGRIAFFNNFMAELSGYELDEVRGEDWFTRFLPDQEKPRIQSLFSAAISGVEVQGNINAIRTRSGEDRMIEWYGKTLVDDEGKPFALLSVGWDITDKLALLTKLQQSERLATVGMMASIFAHEVGNPLNSMYLQAQLLKRRIEHPRPDQPLGPRVDNIMSEIVRLNTLLEEFRSFYRPEQMVLESTDLCRVLRDVLEGLLVPVSGPEIRIEHHIDALPMIRGNADKLKQVFLNLGKNALEAMPAGGTLELRARLIDNRIVVEVSDTGTGIPDGIDVFEPFRTTKPEGTGLGLPLVREIIQSHGGEIRYRSEIGKGTIFTVELPVSS